LPTPSLAEIPDTNHSDAHDGHIISHRRLPLSRGVGRIDLAKVVFARTGPSDRVCAQHFDDVHAADTSIGIFAANLFLQAIAQPINRLDHIKGFVRLLEFSAQALDMTINSTIIDINIILISGIHQTVAVLEYSLTRNQGLQNQKFGDGEADG
jgi:hypothetical protein